MARSGDRRERESRGEGQRPGNFRTSGKASFLTHKLSPQAVRPILEGDNFYSTGGP
jgi:hypothetical protein